jgi:hypothetical protein
MKKDFFVSRAPREKTFLSINVENQTKTRIFLLIQRSTGNKTSSPTTKTHFAVSSVIM